MIHLGTMGGSLKCISFADMYAYIVFVLIESREKTQTFVSDKSTEMRKEEENVSSLKLKETGVLDEKGRRQPSLGLSSRPGAIPPCQP